MLGGVLDPVLALIGQYGYLAVFIYMVLETSFLLHYVPSEVVVPFAAVLLVHDPLSFVLFVVDATAGSILGSVLAYVVFGLYGRGVLERYGHVVHLSTERLEWSEEVFTRYGESSVFWGRMLPFLRAFISIPAGLAGMNVRRFVIYSAGGALLFNTGLTYLVYSGTGDTSPLGLVLAQVSALLARQVAYVQAHPLFVVVLVGIVGILGGVGWVGRNWIRTHPDRATQAGLHLFRIVGVLVGGAFILGALTSPQRAFAAVTAVWNDPLFWVGLGFSDQVALVLIGVGIAFAGLLGYELGRLVEITRLRAVLEATVESLRNR